MNIKQFTQIHPTVSQAAAMAEICKPLKKLGIVYFSHAHIDEKKQMSTIGLCPEFFQLYFEKGYHQYDLHMAKPNSQEEYILWDTLPLKQESKAQHHDFTSFQQGHTFSIVQYHGKQKDIFHFAAKLGDLQMNGKYLQMLDSLKQFILYFKDQIATNKELNYAYDLKIPLIKNKGGFLLDSTGAPLKSIDKLDTNRFYFQGLHNYVTKRELDCLKCISEGKTVETIGEILKITPRTVKAHIANIKAKLGCSNQFQLGMIYAKLTTGLVDYR